MIIETKYNIGDTVYLIDKSRLIKTKIRGIFVNCIQKGDSVFSFPSYDLVYDTNEFIDECRLYSDEQTALESIPRKNYLD